MTNDHLRRWKPTGRTLGQGGQAQVIAVEDTTGALSGMFALKKLAKGKPAQAYARFRRELGTLSSLSHPNIIRVVDVSGDDDPEQFYVMECEPDALSLRAVIANDAQRYFGRPLQCLDLFLQIVEALVACSEAPEHIVHRDLSPANVLVYPDTSIRLIDFGLCQVAEATTITLSDEGLGTPNYMAPECEAGAPGLPTGRADLYSAGKILWAAVAGKEAFAREVPAFTTHSLPNVFPDSVETWHLQEILRHTVRREPSNRWDNARQARFWARRIRSNIVASRDPIEWMWRVCPSCGLGTLKRLSEENRVFGNPMPLGLVGLKCDKCFMCFLVDRGEHAARLHQWSELD